MAIKMRGKMKFLVTAVIIFLGASVPTACHSGPPQVSINDARAILSPAIYGEAMVTMVIKNDGGADVLKGVSTDIAGATTSFHIMEGRRMAQVATVDVPGGQSTVFKMGSSHIMLEGMPRSMVAGSAFTLTLSFEKSGTRQLHLKLEKYPEMHMK